ncbi:MAG: DUF342 domain-containing protein, partial [Clostridiaceae bacterium]|nr:DUF342 domain-containing protein [Clostridiaceae bacterium]
MLKKTDGLSGNSLNNGFFEVEYKTDGVYLTVYPPIGSGKRVELRDVIDKLSIKKIRDFNKEQVELLVMKQEKTPCKIAEAQEEVKVDATVAVTVSPDKMRASILISPPEGGRMLNEKEVTDILAVNGVVSGINSSVIDEITKYPVYNQLIAIAEGTQPVNGQNGKLQFHFNLNKDKKPNVLEDGTVDFRSLNIIESVKSGSILCSLIPPQLGIPGKTVAGKDIPATDGKAAVLPKGRNVEISEDGQCLLSGIDGQVCYIDGKVNVFSNYEVPANVDNSTGNISFTGNVIVRGNVLSGFTVEAGGSVEVWGVVECAVIKAGGDIILRRGMQGIGKGILESGGNIIARYIENSIVQAKENITAEAIMHSNVKCGKKLELIGKKGLLVGGISRVGKEIVAKVIGSYMSTVTEVEVGLDPSLKERFKAVKEEVQVMEEDLKKAEQAITILKKLEQAGNLNSEKQELMARSVRTKVYYSNRIKELKEEMIQIELRLQEEA